MLSIVMSFYGVTSIRMRINTNYVVYNGCRVGMFYISNLRCIREGMYQIGIRAVFY